jgi:hypothetical protein
MPSIRIIASMITEIDYRKPFRIANEFWVAFDLGMSFSVRISVGENSVLSKLLTHTLGIRVPFFSFSHRLNLPTHWARFQDIPSFRF